MALENLLLGTSESYDLIINSRSKSHKYIRSVLPFYNFYTTKNKLLFTKVDGSRKFIFWGQLRAYSIINSRNVL